MGKLITVSFRLPYRLTVSRGKLVASPSVGGLATALRSYFELGAKNDFDSFHWLGISDISKRGFERVSAAETIEKENIVMHPVFLSSRMKDGFYDGFCNSVLWPLFLYFPSFVAYKNEYFAEYVSANELMCNKILDVYNPGDTIWIHDYHWMLLPALLREQLPGAKIGFFLHIPFPSFELFRLLPKSWRMAIILGLMGADVIGFQTEDFSGHFVDSVERLLPGIVQIDGFLRLDGRQSLVRSFSISIDFDKFNIASRTPEVRRNVKRIRERPGATRLILSVDRLDYTKAIFNRLEGFELFLQQNPEFREKVSYLLMMVPTRESILKYKENKSNVEALISKVNGLYGTIGWTPIVYQYQSVDFKKLVSLYAAADVALIVPSRDGMNLVAKEYVASRCHSDGVLILSETAGASNELRDALSVNANDRQEIADAILQGLLMPVDEQHVRIGKMQAQIKKNNVLVWATDFLQAVTGVLDPIEE